MSYAAFRHQILNQSVDQIDKTGKTPFGGRLLSLSLSTIFCISIFTIFCGSPFGQRFLHFWAWPLPFYARPERKCDGGLARRTRLGPFWATGLALGRVSAAFLALLAPGQKNDYMPFKGALCPQGQALTTTRNSGVSPSPAPDEGERPQPTLLPKLGHSPSDPALPAHPTPSALRCIFLAPAFPTGPAVPARRPHPVRARIVDKTAADVIVSSRRGE